MSDDNDSPEKDEADTKGAATKVVKESGNFITRFFSSIFGGFGGLGKGIFGNTLGNPLGVLKSAGIVALIAKFAPSFAIWFPLEIGGKKVGVKLAEDMVQGGTGALIKDSLIAGAAINAVTGGVSGAMGGIASGGDAQGESTVSKIAGFAGGAAAVAAIGFLAFKAVKSNDIGVVGVGDASAPKSPVATPPRANAPIAKQ